MNTEILILVVEDEALLQIVYSEALSEAGFSVTAVRDGRSAMDALEAEPDRFAGVVTDIRLGEGPDGWEVARRARELNSSVAVVYVTGDSAADWPANGVPHSKVLQKPFADAQLVTAVATLLNERPID